MLQTCTVMFFLGGRQQGSGNDIFFLGGGLYVSVLIIYIYIRVVWDISHSYKAILLTSPWTC